MLSWPRPTTPPAPSTPLTRPTSPSLRYLSISIYLSIYPSTYQSSGVIILMWEISSGLFCHSFFVWYILSVCLLVEWMAFKKNRFNWGHLFNLYSSFSSKRTHLIKLVYNCTVYTDLSLVVKLGLGITASTWILWNQKEPTGDDQQKVLTAGSPDLVLLLWSQASF